MRILLIAFVMLNVFFSIEAGIFKKIKEKVKQKIDDFKPRLPRPKIPNVPKLPKLPKPVLPTIRTKKKSNKGMTWKVREWPAPSNNNVGEVGCTGCDAYKGDTPCSEKRKILCLVGAKSYPRPWYNYGPKFSTNAIKDNAFYNGWSGGRYSATPLYQGTLLTKRSVADNFCKKHFGSSARIAEHHDGWYMSYMDYPVATWNWSKARTGGWAAWGYFGTGLGCDNMWAWVKNQNANCGITDY